MLILQKEYERAVTYYERLISFISDPQPYSNEDKRTLTDSEIMHVFTSYINLGSCHFSLKQYLQAKDCIETGLMILEGRNIAGIK